MTESEHLGDNVYATYTASTDTVTLRDGPNVIHITPAVIEELQMFLMAAVVARNIINGLK